MRIRVDEGQLTLIADHDDDETFLVSIAATFAEGGRLYAKPNESEKDCIELEPATPVTT